jgi:membrane protein involved in colicin uptake
MSDFEAEFDAVDEPVAKADKKPKKKVKKAKPAEGATTTAPESATKKKTKKKAAAEDGEEPTAEQPKKATKAKKAAAKAQPVDADFEAEFAEVAAPAPQSPTAILSGITKSNPSSTKGGRGGDDLFAMGDSSSNPYGLPQAKQVSNPVRVIFERKFEASDAFELVGFRYSSSSSCCRKEGKEAAS